jgi:hypothetical protein
MYVKAGFMELLESEWFFRMVESYAKSPKDRLVAVFTVTGNWISAPGIRDTFTKNHAPITAIGLQGYLTRTAASAGASNPSSLAAQLIILLQGALAEELRAPGIRAMENAAMAAQAVVYRACRPGRRSFALRWSAAGSAATILVAALVWHLLPAAQTAPGDAVLALHTSPHMRIAARQPMGINPGDMETALALQEQIDRGNCPAPQLLVLPQGQVTAYMNVIHFRTPENPAEDRRNLHTFLTWFNQTRARECYYPPVNGHTMVSWR